jgi:hypothetical protein
MATFFTTNDYCVTDSSFAYGSISVSPAPDAILEAFVESNWMTQPNNAPFSSSAAFQRLFHVKRDNMFDYANYNTQAIAPGYSLPDIFSHRTELISAVEDLNFEEFFTEFHIVQYTNESFINNGSMTFRITNSLYGRDYRFYLRINQDSVGMVSSLISSISGELRLLIKMTFLSFATANKMKYDNDLTQANLFLTSSLEQRKVATLHYEVMKQERVAAKIAMEKATLIENTTSYKLSTASDQLDATNEILTSLSNDTTTNAYKNALIARNNAVDAYNLAGTALQQTEIVLEDTVTKYNIAITNASNALTALNAAIENVSTAAVAITTATSARSIPTQNYIRASTEPYFMKRYLSDRVSVTTTTFNRSLSNLTDIDTYILNCSVKNRVADRDIILERPIAFQQLTNASSVKQTVMDAVTKANQGDYSAVSQLLIQIEVDNIETERINASNKQPTYIVTTQQSLDKENLYAEYKIKKEIQYQKKIEAIAANEAFLAASAEESAAQAELLLADSEENRSMIAQKQSEYNSYETLAIDAEEHLSSMKRISEIAVNQVTILEYSSANATEEARIAKAVADADLNTYNQSKNQTNAVKAKESGNIASEKINRAKDLLNELVIKKQDVERARLQVEIAELRLTEKIENKKAAADKLKDAKNVVDLPKAKATTASKKKGAALNRKGAKDNDYTAYNADDTTIQDAYAGAISETDLQATVENLTLKSASAQAGGAAAQALLNSESLTVNDVKQFLTDYADSDTSGESANSALNNLMSGDIVGSLTNIYDLVNNYDPVAAATKAGLEMEEAIRNGDPAEAAKIAGQAALVALMASALGDAIAASEAAKDISNKLSQNPPDVLGATMAAGQFLGRRILAKIATVQFLVGFTGVLVVAAIGPLVDFAKEQFSKAYSFIQENMGDIIGLGKVAIDRLIGDFKEDERAGKEAANKSWAELNKSPPNIAGAANIMINLVGDRALARIESAGVVFNAGVEVIGARLNTVTDAMDSGIRAADEKLKDVGNDIVDGILGSVSSISIPITLHPSPEAAIENLTNVSNLVLSKILEDHNISNAVREVEGLYNEIADTLENFFTEDFVNFFEGVGEGAEQFFDDVGDFFGSW